MKTFRNLIAALAAVAVFASGGCKSQPKINVFPYEPSKPQVQGSGFADESYVWESWVHSTNRVPDGAVKCSTNSAPAKAGK